MGGVISLQASDFYNMGDNNTSMYISIPYLGVLFLCLLFSYWTHKNRELSNTVFLWFIFTGVLMAAGGGYLLQALFYLIFGFGLAILLFIVVPTGGFKVIPVIFVFLPFSIHKILPLPLAIVTCSLSLLYVIYYLARKKIHVPYLSERTDSGDWYINVPAIFTLVAIIFLLIPSVGELNVEINRKITSFFASGMIFDQILKLIMLLSILILQNYEALDKFLEKCIRH